MRRWGGGEELTKSGTWDDVLTTTHMLVSGIFRPLTTFVVVLGVVTKDRECFLLQMKCVMSVSVEIIFY